MPVTTSEFIEECRFVYDALYTEAEEDHEGGVIWQGSITKWFKDKGIPTDKYSKVMQTLKGMGCIEVINQGTRYTPTMYQLLEPPTVDLWVKANSEGKFVTSRIKKVKGAEQRMKTLEDRVAKLENLVGLLLAKEGVEL